MATANEGHQCEGHDMKERKRRAEFHSDDDVKDAAPGVLAPRELPPPPLRRSQNDKMDKALAFLAHQNQQNMNFNAHFSYTESLMQELALDRGMDLSTFPPQPPFLL